MKLSPDEGKRRRIAIAMVLAMLTAVGCGTSGIGIDGGGSGTGLGFSTISGNLAPTTAEGDAPAQPVCPVIGSSAMVSVRGTGLAAPIESDCRFEIDNVPAGDVTLDFESRGAKSTLELNNVPPDSTLVLTDVRLLPDDADAAAVEVEAATPTPVPRARIIADPPKGEVPLEVHFSVITTVTGTPLVRWNFGDRSPGSSELEPTHVYTRPGEFIVHLRFGTSAADLQDVFTVVSVQRPPVPGALRVRLTARPRVGPAPLDVELTAALLNAVPPVRFLWKFGDGEMQVTSEPVVRHTYADSGPALAVVSVRDGAGREAGDAFGILVMPAPTAMRRAP